MFGAESKHTLWRAAPLPVFHVPTSRTSERDGHRNETLERLRTELSKLCSQLNDKEGFEGFEREVHEAFVRAEREVLAEGLERFDVDVPYVHIDGRRHQRVLRASETYTSAVGAVTVMRTLYRAGTGKSVVPLELRTGIVEGHWTPLAARQASFLVAQLTPQECADTLRELGNMVPSKSTSSQGTERALGGRSRALRSGDARAALSTDRSGLVGSLAGWGDGADEGWRTRGQAGRGQSAGPADAGAGGLPGSGLRHAVVLRRRR